MNKYSSILQTLIKDLQQLTFSTGLRFMHPHIWNKEKTYCPHCGHTTWLITYILSKDDCEWAILLYTMPKRDNTNKPDYTQGTWSGIYNGQTITGGTPNEENIL